MPEYLTTDRKLFERLREKYPDCCGCCGRECKGRDWCLECEEHLRPSHVPPWERTYYAQHTLPCPFDVD